MTFMPMMSVRKLLTTTVHSEISLSIQINPWGCFRKTPRSQIIHFSLPILMFLFLTFGCVCYMSAHQDELSVD